MLKRVSIQNFKSLKDVTLDLQKINLLIGPNNSGKTNFLKALEFCEYSLVYEDVKLDDIKFNREIENEIFIQLVFETLEPFDIHNYEHIVYLEYFDINNYVSSFKRYKVSSDSTFYNPQLKSTKAIADDLKYHVRRITIYKPDPNQLIKAAPVGNSEEVVSGNTSNLVSFLDLMLGKYRKPVFNRMETDLHTCIPEFDEISLDDALASEELKKQYGDKSFKRLGLTNSEQGMTYWADELSEGTLYFIALLCIINQPNPPKLLLLEEPEKGIHPRRIHEVIQFIFRLAEEKDIQVIMTTHSPVVLDMFAEMPESVFIFDKDDEGATHVKNLQRDVIEPDTERSKALGVEPPRYTDALGDSWTIGFLGGVPK